MNNWLRDTKNQTDIANTTNFHYCKPIEQGLNANITSNTHKLFTYILNYTKQHMT